MKYYRIAPPAGSRVEVQWSGDNQRWSHCANAPTTADAHRLIEARQTIDRICDEHGIALGPTELDQLAACCEAISEIDESYRR